MRVLVVEDDNTLAFSLEEALSRESYKVDCLFSAEPAEGALQSTAYDLAIIDIGLPGMNGFELVSPYSATCYFNACFDINRARCTQ